MLSFDRPDWWDRARCLGMAQAFTNLDHSEQQEVCRECPVVVECLESILERVERFGMRELTDGNLVCGGLTPAQIRKVRNRRASAVYTDHETV